MALKSENARQPQKKTMPMTQPSRSRADQAHAITSGNDALNTSIPIETAPSTCAAEASAPCPVQNDQFMNIDAAVSSNAPNTHIPEIKARMLVILRSVPIRRGG